MRRRTPALLLVVGLGLGLAACGGDGDDEATDDSTTTTAATDASATTDDGATTTSPPDDGGASTSSPEDTGTTTAPDGSTTTVADGDLPGEPLDIYPYEGARLAVVGVASDDTLNVRAGPGTTFDVVVEMAPRAEGATATGRNRTLDDGSFWSELVVDGVTGWANGAYLAQLGGARDITDEVTAPPEGTSPADVARGVAAQRTAVGEGPSPSVTVVQQTDSEATVDVLGLGDDAQKGERLHVRVEGAGVTATATALCARGVTADGLCT